MKKYLLLAVFVLLTYSCNPTAIHVDLLKVEDLNGKPLDFESLKGNPVFLNIWATWCGPCIHEFPAIQNLKKEFEKEGWVFVLASDESKEKIRAFSEQRNFELDFYKMQQRLQDLGISSIPQTYILNSEGEVVKAISGGMIWDSPAMKDQLRKLVE